MNNNQPSNNYDFILNPEKNKASRPTTNSSQNKRLLQVIIGGVGLLFVLVIVFSLLSGSGSSTAVDFEKLLAKQNDIIAITNDATKNSQNTVTLNNASTVRAVLTSHSAQTTTALAKLGQKSSAKVLALYANNSYVNQLQLAFNGGTYDATYDSIMIARLGDYDATIQTAYTATKSTSTKQLLHTFYQDEQSLVKNIPTN